MPSSEPAIRIQHHPSREHLLPRLLTDLTDFKDVEVIPDPGGQLHDAWRAHHACLKAMPDTASHLYVLQDDGLPVPGHHVKTLAAIERHPESVLLLFVPGFNDQVRHMRMAQKQGATFLRFFPGAYVPTVAIIYPRAVVDGLLHWTDGTHSDRYRRPMRGADDGIVASYCRRVKIRPVALVPSLVEHDDDPPSISGRHRGKGRHRRAALL